MAALILDPSVLDAEGSDAAVVLADLRGDDRNRTVERLGAHTGGYPARIREALLESYPAVEHVVGAATFGELVRRYLPQVPYGIYSLGDVGRAFERFLGTDELGRTLPFLPDLARLEWSVQCAFHARLVAPLDPAPLAGWSVERWNEAVLTFQPGVTLVASEWPIVDIWRAREKPIEEISIELEGRPQCAFIHRVGFRVACTAVDGTHAEALASLLRGDSLGAAMRTVERCGGGAEAVSAWFAAWMRDGIIVSCTVPTLG